ncbi:DUF1656 domain-containing protein [Rosistilla oblonga]|uniref:Uncharacterized protein n=2 Tax=Bacteria TaxID=2 RepID=A0A518IZK9_9BACT|nr:hypothetical protein Mal33_45500 [Rosistilla oblonga]
MHCKAMPWRERFDSWNIVRYGVAVIVLVKTASEISLGWVYITPALVAVTLGFLAAYGVTWLLNATRLARFFWNPGLTFVAFVVLFTSLIGLLFIPL